MVDFVVGHCFPLFCFVKFVWPLRKRTLGCPEMEWTRQLANRVGVDLVKMLWDGTVDKVFQKAPRDQ